MGRIACIKMNNVLDSLAILAKEVKLSLPLAIGKKGEPLIYPSSFLLQWIRDYDPANPDFQINPSSSGKPKQERVIELFDGELFDGE